MHYGPFNLGSLPTIKWQWIFGGTIPQHNWVLIVDSQFKGLSNLSICTLTTQKVEPIKDCMSCPRKCL
jgi:hypothetical protein